MKLLFLVGSILFCSFIGHSQETFNSIDSALLYPKDVDSLFFDEHLFTEFPNVDSMVNLKSIHLKYCSNYSDVFLKLSKLPLLSELWITDVEMDELSLSIGLLTNLKILRLTECRLKNLPDTLKSLTKLEELSLVNNLLREIPLVISELPNLVRLNFKKNKIKSFSANFGKNLTHLNLSHNRLESLPKGVVVNNKLMYLDITDNNLKSACLVGLDLPKLK
ncbi:MAG: leucine-rich repeat domain-containing protein, partial [Flavobacteriales bacterium]|nr:leucine-rich repeat domain-containing protein [Flavobacteriales bacterium]